MLCLSFILLQLYHCAFLNLQKRYATLKALINAGLILLFLFLKQKSCFFHLTVTLQFLDLYSVWCCSEYIWIFILFFPRLSFLNSTAILGTL